MTSPSLKNHPTTAPLTGSEPALSRSLWKRFLTGTLCLCFASALPAVEREGVKPLERLKQRSARQRWREMRGDMSPKQENPPATAPQTDTPPQVITPFSNWMRTQARPIPASHQPAASEVHPQETPVAIPVPTPIAIEPESETNVVSRPGAKPPANINEPTHHPGSFGDVEIEQRVTKTRQRLKIPLPHWPFQDDLDLVS